MLRLSMLVLVALGIAACDAPSPFLLTSDAFGEGDSIPVRHTCEGEDLSPPLAWTHPPTGTQSFALVMDDPDAPGGTWDHWLLYDLDPALRRLEEGAGNEAGEESIPGISGNNSWGRLDYGGPCPPEGAHQYHFKLYALDAMLGLGPGADSHEMEEAMEGHVLGQTILTGIYARP